MTGTPSTTRYIGAPSSGSKDVQNYLDSFRGELKEELKVNLKEEMKVGLKEEMKSEIKEEIRKELKEEMREELKEEMIVRLPDPKLKTLGERGIECISVGYAEHFKAFRPSQRSLINGTEDIDGSVVPEEGIEEVVTQQPKPELRKSKRNKTAKDFGPEFQLYLIKGIRNEVSDQHSYCFNVEDDLKTFDEAMKSQDVALWKEAINDEMVSIMGNNT
ncbi:hypothetical protein Tco_0714303 [Tanacetum coccineum]